MSEREHFSTGTPWEPVVGYSRAVRVGDRILVSGTTAAAEGGPVGGDDVAAQTREALRRIQTAIEALGGSISDVVLTRVYVADISHWEEVGRVHGEVFAGILPVTSMVEVSALIDARLLIEIEAEAVLA